MTRLTYAIGDIHGRLDLLERADDMIDAHAGARPYRVVCLGDYVDRGPDSAGVIAFLMKRQAAGRYVCLKGNHEDMMVEAFRDGDLEGWREDVGDATLRSFDGALSAGHLAWMADLPVHLRDDHRIFVHAGLMPGVALEDQEDDVCLWIRRKFLIASADSFPAHIVHGHTPVHDDKPLAFVPELLPHRTNLDTAAFMTGVMAVAVFEDDRPGGPVEVLTVRGAARGAD